MFKLLYTSDLHGSKPLYQRLAKRASEKDIDAVAIGGDLCPRALHVPDTINLQKEFLEGFLLPLLGDFNKGVYIIMGNDDFRINSNILENSSIKNVHYIHKKSVKLNKNYFISGYGFVNPTPFRLKDWEKKEGVPSAKPEQIKPGEARSIGQEHGTIKDDLEMLKKLSNPKKTIYLAHAPPFNTNLDIITDRTHVGSIALRKFIEKEQPPLTLHGHIHESPRMSGLWKDKIGATICINAGSSYPEDKLNCIAADLEDLNSIEYFEI